MRGGGPRDLQRHHHRLVLDHGGRARKAVQQARFDCNEYPMGLRCRERASSSKSHPDSMRCSKTLINHLVVGRSKPNAEKPSGRGYFSSEVGCSARPAQHLGTHARAPLAAINHIVGTISPLAGDAGTDYGG